MNLSHIHSYRLKAEFHAAALVLQPSRIDAVGDQAVVKLSDRGEDPKARPLGALVSTPSSRLTKINPERVEFFQGAYELPQ